MKRIKHSIIIFTSLLILLQIGCTQYPVLQEPDAQMFKQTVQSEFLQDSLMHGKLTAGMPRFVVDQLFKNYADGLKEIKIPVATLGSKQRLEEEEGWSRKFVDPNINVFLDKYETSQGRLYVWYQRPDFYRMDVSARDTLCIFFEDTVFCSVINYLNKSSVLTVRDSLPQIPVRTSLYAEVRYNDHPWREVSYWYNIEILSNAKTFKLGDINYELYPIELLEFNNEPVSSFKWREVNKNED
ncbi:MAG: hypothetical protein A2W30_06980 [Ignavibacteria bacterium RBG_16_36_9]|nr:MAG: hypothetical protein A2W30_06980 [Ignavibacteria bacterium RBG_16_36_9]